jgi:hypothetical protein
VPAPQPFQPKLHMTDADFLSITLNGKLCDNEGGLGEREFELVMREQVRRLHAMTSLPAARAFHAAHQLNAWGKGMEQVIVSSPVCFSLVSHSTLRRSDGLRPNIELAAAEQLCAKR